MSAPRNHLFTYLVRPDVYACQTARPNGQVDEHALISARVNEHARAKPAIILPLIGGWLVAVMCMQIVLQLEVARVLWPLQALGIVLCGAAWIGVLRKRLPAQRAWAVVSVASWIQVVSFVLAYFLTGFEAYQTAVVVVILTTGVLDMRGRAVQWMVFVVMTTWLISAASAQETSASVWNFSVVLGACTTGLVVHMLSLRAAYTVEWLRVMNHRRSCALADALGDSQEELQLRQRAESKLKRAVDDLQAAQAHLLQAHKLEAIGQLAAGVAHEINTPTQYVSDNTTFLQTAFEKLLVAVRACRVALEPAESVGAEVEAARAALAVARVDYHSKHVPRALEQSLEGLRRIASLVAALKEFSHPSAGVKSSVSLNETIQMTIAVARNEWKYVAEVTTDLDADMAGVWCLRDELSQVVLNLLVNAAHAIGERSDRAGDGGALGKIEVRTRRDGDDAVIEIEDDGSGIPDSIRHRIFEPFFTTKPVGKGTGQGLAIAYNVIVEKHHGTLELDSEVGRGTTFTIRIPIAGSPNEDLAAHLPAA